MGRENPAKRALERAALFDECFSYRGCPSCQAAVRKKKDDKHRSPMWAAIARYDEKNRRFRKETLVVDLHILSAYGTTKAINKQQVRTNLFNLCIVFQASCSAVFERAFLGPFLFFLYIPSH